MGNCIRRRIKHVQQRKLQIVNVKFCGMGKYGDFGWMISQPQFTNSLFVFNDNIEDHCTARVGGGNAVMRPYNQYGHHSPPRSAGIPTGEHGRGFMSLTDGVVVAIDNAVIEIRELLVKYHYTTVYFSSDDSGKSVGTGIFTVGNDVCKYIATKVKKLAN